MRAVLVLLVLGLAAWGLTIYLPDSTAEGKESAGAEPAISFLERPEDAPAPDAAEVPGAPGPERPPATPGRRADAGRAEPPASGAFGLSARDLPSGGQEDVLLAQALLFGEPADVERALARLDVDDVERRLCVAFALALAGDRKAGLQTAHGLDAPGALAAPDHALLQEALTGKGSAAPRAASSRAEPLTRRAMRLRLAARDADEVLARGAHAQAAGAYSELLIAALREPWEAERDELARWTAGLNAAQAHHRWDPRADWPSVEFKVQDGDTLTHVRKRYLAAHPDGLVCTGLIERANQISGYIHPGDTLRVPTERASVLVDLSSQWLLYLLGDEVAAAWEVGIGREGQATITGTFRAADKQEEPTWFREGEAPQAFPDNPLGTRWIAWYRDGRKTGYGFHGTWEPETIGAAASDGCIRLRNEDVEVLFQILPVGARIEVQD